MYILTWLFGVFCGIFLFELLKSLVLYSSFQQLEARLLFMAANLVQYKYHAIKIIEIAYSIDENKKQECERIVSKIHEKFDSYGDSWIEILKRSLPYETKYRDWKTALQYIEQLITKEQSND